MFQVLWQLLKWTRRKYKNVLYCIRVFFKYVNWYIYNKCARRFSKCLSNKTPFDWYTIEVLRLTYFLISLNSRSDICRNKPATHKKQQQQTSETNWTIAHIQTRNLNNSCIFLYILGDKLVGSAWIEILLFSYDKTKNNYKRNTLLIREHIFH